MKLPEQYTYEYRKVYTGYSDTWVHWYQIVGRFGGVHLYVSESKYEGVTDYSPGLEYHYRVPPSYLANEPPTANRCFLLQTPCWHSGTSTYAREKYLPMHLAGETEDIFRDMVLDADRAFLSQNDGTVLEKIKELGAQE